MNELEFNFGFMNKKKIPVEDIKNDGDNALKLFLQQNKDYIVKNNNFGGKNNEGKGIKDFIEKINTDANIGLEPYEIYNLAKRFTEIEPTSLTDTNGNQISNLQFLHTKGMLPNINQPETNNQQPQESNDQQEGGKKTRKTRKTKKNKKKASKKNRKTKRKTKRR